MSAVLSRVIRGRTDDPGRTRAALDRCVQSVDGLRTTAGVTPEGSFVAVLLSDSQAQWPDTTQLLDTLASPRVSTGLRTETFFPADPSRTGFVQVVQGAVSDLDEAFRGLIGFQDLLAIHAPYLLGTVTIAHESGRFTRVLHFSSEEKARAGEARRVPEVQRSDEELLRLLVGPVAFIDLRDPWLLGQPRSASA